MKLVRYRFVGEAITARRKRAHLSQDAVALYSGISQHYLSMLERSRHIPSVLKLANIAAAIGCKPADLLAECLQREEIEVDP